MFDVEPRNIESVAQQNQSTTVAASNLTFGEEDFWFHPDMYDINWIIFFKKMAPILSQAQRSIILDATDQSGINPLMIVTAILSKNIKGDFEEEVQNLSGGMVGEFYDLEQHSNTKNGSSVEKDNLAATAVLNFYRGNNLMMNEFIALFKLLKEEAINNKPGEDEGNGVSPISDNLKRGIDYGPDTEQLIWPFKKNECWQIGPTHSSIRNCYRNKCAKNSLDMAPSLYHPFEQTFDYFQSSGEVIAAHSGTAVVQKDNDCKVIILGKNLNTYYSHIDITVKHGQHVDQGDTIGLISIRRIKSNCNCDISRNNQECATGPHLHFELRETNGKPLHLDQKVINGYKIKSGWNSYDYGCKPQECRPNMNSTEIKSSCATIFQREGDGEIFCPSIKGASAG